MKTIVRNSYTPKMGDYCNKIVVDEDAGVQYIFDCDGMFTTYTSKQQEGAPMSYVDAKANEARLKAYAHADAKDAEVLAEAKKYTDEHGGGTGDVKKEYVDAQDAATLAAAKSADNTLHTAITKEINNKFNDAPVITVQSTDPGEGAALAANHFIAVYQGGE